MKINKLNFKKRVTLKASKGFTLIELLVVVAIIGVLSTIVVAALNGGRSKGKDSAIKSDLANLRGQAEVLFANNGGYGVDATPTAFTLGACTNTADTLFADSTVWAQLTDAMNNSGGLESCVSTSTAWSVGIQLAEKSTTEAWCVDSSGQSKKLTLDGTPTQAELNALIVNASSAPLCD